MATTNAASAPVVGSFGARTAAAAVTGQQQAAANATAVTVGHRSRLNG